MNGYKRFALALVVLSIFTAATAPAQRRRTGRQSRVKTPVGTAAYIRISTAALFKEVGLLRSMIEVLDFGDKVFLSPEDFSNDSDYIEIKSAKSGRKGFVNKLAIAQTMEELTAIKSAGAIPNRLIRIDAFFPLLGRGGSMSVTSESHVIDTPRDIDVGDAVYFVLQTTLVTSLCDNLNYQSRYYKMMSTLCANGRSYKSHVVYYRDNTSLREWHYGVLQ